MSRLELIRYAILCGMVICGCALSSMRCTPAETQAMKRDLVAVHAQAENLVEYCAPEETVKNCIDYLLSQGFRKIDLVPQDGGQ